MRSAGVACWLTEGTVTEGTVARRLCSTGDASSLTVRPFHRRRSTLAIPSSVPAESPLNGEAAQELMDAALVARYEEKARKAAASAPRKA